MTRKEEATTRFTQLTYIDSAGYPATLEARGWVGMVEESAKIDFSAILGQMYFERPGANAPLDTPGFTRQLNASGVSEITVVDLWSTDGAQRMCQEFYGRIDDEERRRELLRGRLGRAMSEWKLVRYHVLRVPQADFSDRWHHLGARVRRILHLWRRGSGRPSGR
jgi:hypothetical protein